LDAIGAIGIARTFSFGGKFSRPLYEPNDGPRENLTQEQYTKQSHNSSTVNHFYEKLLKLKDLMKSKAGQRIAEERHKFMELFLQRFYDEWDGKI